MKRTLLLLLLVALPASAAQEKWWDAYNRGIKAVNSKNYDVAVASLQKSIAEMPAENTAVRTRSEIIVYLPHFWLGIAKFNQGDVDGSLREWKTSEEQGAIVKTDYYSKLRDWVARAQAEKVRGAQNAAAGSKNAADSALSRALAGQMEALSAGADRGDAYRAANRKLQEALALFNSAGSDIKTYERATATAAEAKEMFSRASEDAKKAKASRPVQVAKAPPAGNVQPPPAPVLESAKPAAIPAESGGIVPKPVVDKPAAPPSTAADGGAAAKPVVQVVAAAVTPKPAAEGGGAPPAVAQVVTVPQKPVETQPVLKASLVAVMPSISAKPARSQLETAYRAFASGDVGSSEQVLTMMLTSSPTSEAYLLRGCARYTRAMLSRSPDLTAAKSDFRTALKMNKSLRLDRSNFSPKLVAFFEEVRKGG